MKKHIFKISERTESQNFLFNFKDKKLKSSNMGAADNAVLPVARNPPSKRHCGQHISFSATP